jgi:flagellar motor switch protein FliG
VSPAPSTSVAALAPAGSEPSSEPSAAETPLRLSGPRRAALFILGLPEEVASLVLRNLGEEDLRRLASETENLDSRDLAHIDPAMVEFERRFRDSTPMGRPGDHLRRLTSTTLGSEKARRLFDPAMDDVPALEAIRQARTQTLAELLQDEPPQIAAVIVSQLPREQGAKVLMAMPIEQQGDILARIASLREVPAHAVQIASESLARELASAGGLGIDERREFDGVSFSASMLNELPPTDTERLLSGLQDRHEKLVPKIREAMFTFEDLARIDVRQLQVLMREVQSEQLLLALKTASESLRDKFLSSVSSRAAQSMREDLQLMPPMRLADVESAQREIVEAAMRLSSEGRLSLPGSKSERMV